jgi:hypothetical protein
MGLFALPRDLNCLLLRWLRCADPDARTLRRARAVCRGWRDFIDAAWPLPEPLFKHLVALPIAWPTRAVSCYAFTLHVDPLSVYDFANADLLRDALPVLWACLDFVAAQTAWKEFQRELYLHQQERISAEKFLGRRTHEMRVAPTPAKRARLEKLVDKWQATVDRLQVEPPRAEPPSEARVLEVLEAFWLAHRERWTREAALARRDASIASLTQVLAEAEKSVAQARGRADEIRAWLEWWKAIH